MSKILIVEDNDDLAFGLRRTLEFEGHDIAVASDGPSGLAQAMTEGVDLVVLDLMLPKLDGFKVLREIRKGGSRVPVLLLTARGDEADILMGFDSGADDYVTKPFSTLELLARVRALLRRGTTDGTVGQTDSSTSRFGSVEIDESTRMVSKGDEPVSLTPKEFDLLLALLRRNGGIASRAELLDEVWHYANSDVLTRTVDIHIAELRRKIEDDPAEPRHILTVRKAGYRLQS
jgi:DNA-binding response OmpR family regulator